MGIERRDSLDRRVLDVGSPLGWSERRTHTERRLPAVEEADISADDFAKYFGSAGKRAKADRQLYDYFAEVFSRSPGRH
jgi:hypothetical protein